MHSHVSVIVLLTFYCITKCFVLGNTSNNIAYVNHEQSLRADLLGNYSNSIRPNASSELYINFVLLALNDLNIEDQEMSLVVILHTIWYDERLKWAPSDYGGIEGITVTLADVWSPGIFVRNSARNMKLLGSDNMPFRVWYTGRVLWAPFALMETSCEMQVLYFPFEEQECTIILFPNGYLSNEVNLKLQNEREPITRQYYEPNAAWKFISGSSGNTSLEDGYDNYLALTYTLKFRRRWLFMALSLVLPSILNLILMMGVFTLHIESGEKMGYSLTVLLSYIVLMTLVGDMLPQVSTEISILQIYLAGVLMVGCVSTLLTIWVINVYNRDDEKELKTLATTMLVKWVLLPFTSVVFWRYFKWRFFQRRNKILDGKDHDVGSGGTESLFDTDGENFVPPKSTYTPCSLDSLRLDTRAEIRKMTKSYDSVYRNDMPFSKKEAYNQTSANVFSDSGLGKSTPDSLETGSEKELTLYTDTSPTPPPPTFSNPNSPKHEMDKRLNDITWKDIALLMDSFLLRFLGGTLLIFTTIVLLILFLKY